jgi:uncharacterized membrane protein YbaN (DUF454 family)
MYKLRWCCTSRLAWLASSSWERQLLSCCYFLNLHQSCCWCFCSGQNTLNWILFLQLISTKSLDKSSNSFHKSISLKLKFETFGCSGLEEVIKIFMYQMQWRRGHLHVIFIASTAFALKDKKNIHWILIKESVTDNTKGSRTNYMLPHNTSLFHEETFDDEYKGIETIV